MSDSQWILKENLRLRRSADTLAIELDVMKRENEQVKLELQKCQMEATNAVDAERKLQEQGF